MIALAPGFLKPTKIHIHSYAFLAGVLAAEWPNQTPCRARVLVRHLWPDKKHAVVVQGMRGHAARYAATIIRVRSDACRLDKIQSPAMSPRTPSELAIWVSQHSTHGYLSTAHGWTEALALVVEGSYWCCSVSVVGPCMHVDPVSMPTGGW